MSGFDPVYFTWALLLGGLSAISLPMGSGFGLLLRPSDRPTGALAAFGAGALIAALAVELVAPTVGALHEHGVPRHEAVTNFVALMFGAVMGGLLFVTLDQLVNQRGGFLRKTATTIGQFRIRKRERDRLVLEALGKVSLLRNIPPEQVGPLVEDVQRVFFNDQELIFQEGDAGDRLFFIFSGEVALHHRGRPLATLGAGDVLGEIALLADTPRTATARAKGDVEALALGRVDFERQRRLCPELDEATRRLASDRLHELRERDGEHHEERSRWAADAANALHSGATLPTPAEIRELRAEHEGAPLAVWLGILLDGIPESIVIGSGFLALVSMKAAAGVDPGFAEVVPYTLIAGLFLSNFPEAMSSSVGMKHQGWSHGRILFLWSTLTVVTALGAGLGYVLGEILPEALLAGTEGVAAGAMLTMIASTMVPEAVHLGGRNIVGISTLMGFLGAVAFKIFE